MLGESPALIMQAGLERSLPLAWVILAAWASPCEADALIPAKYFLIS